MLAATLTEKGPTIARTDPEAGYGMIKVKARRGKRVRRLSDFDPAELLGLRRKRK